MKQLVMTGPPTPGASILHCPYCGLEVHRVEPGDLMAPLKRAAEAEAAVRAHLAEAHPLRWRWLRFRLGLAVRPGRDDRRMTRFLTLEGVALVAVAAFVLVVLHLFGVIG